ncbi:MAG TPA: hypothetical protein ENI45_03825 [Thermoplasmatales archaeon]|nr:hypothetical protein [Thermoplasmatales archaeon]
MEKIKDLLPPGFPINDETEIKVGNGTVWVETPVDLNNWSFPNLEEVVSRYTRNKELEELSREIEESQNEMEKAMRGLEGLEKDLKELEKEIEELEETRHILVRSLAITLSFLMIFLFTSIGGVVRRLLSRE